MTEDQVSDKKFQPSYNEVLAVNFQR